MKEECLIEIFNKLLECFSYFRNFSPNVLFPVCLTTFPMEKIRGKFKLNIIRKETLLTVIFFIFLCLVLRITPFVRRRKYQDGRAKDWYGVDAADDDAGC